MLDRLRLRGPNGAQDEFYLAATAQNLRKLAKPIPSQGRRRHEAEDVCPRPNSLVSRPRRHRLLQRYPPRSIPKSGSSDTSTLSGSHSRSLLPYCRCWPRCGQKAFRSLDAAPAAKMPSGHSGHLDLSRHSSSQPWRPPVTPFHK